MRTVQRFTALVQNQTTAAWALSSSNMKIELEYLIYSDTVSITAPKFGRTIRVDRCEDDRTKFEVSVVGGSYGIYSSFAKAVSFAESQIKATIKNNDI